MNRPISTMKEQTQELGALSAAEENWTNINAMLQIENLQPSTVSPDWKQQLLKSSSILLSDVSTPISTPNGPSASNQDSQFSYIYETENCPSHKMLPLAEISEAKDELVVLGYKTRSKSVEPLEGKGNHGEVYSIGGKEWEPVSKTGSSGPFAGNSEDSILFIKRKSSKLKSNVSDSRVSYSSNFLMSGKRPAEKEIDVRTPTHPDPICHTSIVGSDVFHKIIEASSESPREIHRSLALTDKELSGRPRITPGIDDHITSGFDDCGREDKAKSILTNIIKSSGSDNMVATLHTFYWESAMRQKTERRRCNKKKKRKWGEQNIFRVMKNIQKVGNVMDTKSYYSVFSYSNGRTTPWIEMIISLVWTTIFLGLHKNYWDLVGHGFTFDPWFSYSFFNYFGIAMGFLLYMQASACSARWWESRVNWQIIIEKSKMLAVLLNTHLSCLRLSKYGMRLIIAHLICVRNVMQVKYDPIWEEEMLEVLDRKTVDMIMIQPRRLRYFAVLYGFQRLIELCIEYQILPREVIREINPTIITISTSIGACSRVRVTKLPWIIAVHLQFMLVVFIVFLPLTLVGVERRSDEDEELGWFVDRAKIGWLEIYIYQTVIAYAFFGLSHMSVDISDPFSFSKENHSFGFWGFYEYHSAIELENVRKIFGFRINKQGAEGLNADGDYGDKWASKKFGNPIRKALSKELPETNALYGRRTIIEQQLFLNRRATSYWRHINNTISEDDDTSFTFASASEDENLVVSEHLRRSLQFDRTVVPRRSAIQRISEYANRLPSFRQSLV